MHLASQSQRHQHISFDLTHPYLHVSSLCHHRHPPTMTSSSSSSSSNSNSNNSNHSQPPKNTRASPPKREHPNASLSDATSTTSSKQTQPYETWNPYPSPYKWHAKQFPTSSTALESTHSPLHRPIHKKETRIRPRRKM